MTKGRKFSTTTYESTKEKATDGGKQTLTQKAEERYQQDGTLDPLIDPKGPPHLGPVRYAWSRFEQKKNLWHLPCGIAMAVERLIDTTGSMQNNIALAFESAPILYQMLGGGKTPVLGRYDPQLATAIFGDVYDWIRERKPPLCRTQFEFDERMATQMANMIPSRLGWGNGKEDPQYGLFAAQFLTNCSAERYGLKTYHFTASDEPTAMDLNMRCLNLIFGNDVVARVQENGYNIDPRRLPDTAEIVAALQKKRHAFFLQVPGGEDSRVRNQWTELYGKDHVVFLTEGTRYLSQVQALIIGLTEGTLSLLTAKEFLKEWKVPKQDATEIIASVEHIPIGAQRLCPNFNRIPLAGAMFENKGDLWPIDPALAAGKDPAADSREKATEWL
ncbi:MAG TPA: hypothetical protein P5080_00070 [Candidatus Paceibacterota bacterium]|nr:hypothetical protein [Candidatus Pacearchaeota archaeon]HRZ50369.1 hypothetical protein [Candidatus Paceibacterota bacterium]HSA36090.1 hypothetical protein [Candidatus Paceibacterota bacterium]